ncbi:MAG: type 1 glutamine amidotransferase [Anaerolineaceae bacterium]|nr:type 1 glutamine amidotransferase [Anaerolineaceae bacterium]
MAALGAAGQFLAACQAQSIVGDLALFVRTATPTATATATATSTPTLTPTPTATLTPTATPTATPTSTSTSTSTPSPTQTPTEAPTATPTATPARGPLTAVALIHGPSRALIVDHVLQRLGVVSMQVRVDLGETVPDLRNYDAVIFAGGEYRPEEFDLPIFQAERERIMEALDARVPILGICLGNQLLAHWLGGEVVNGSWEIGWLPITVTEAGLGDPLLAGLGETFYGFLWHGDLIKRLPENAVILASTEKCPVQAFRLGDLPVWGVQFNPQYDPVIAEGVIRAAKTLHKYGYNLDEMVATGYREYNDVADRIFGNFFEEAQKERDGRAAPVDSATANPDPGATGQDAP